MPPAAVAKRAERVFSPNRKSERAPCDALAFRTRASLAEPSNFEAAETSEATQHSCQRATFACRRPPAKPTAIQY